MLGAFSRAGSSVLDSNAGRCLCLDSLNMNLKSNGEMNSQSSCMKRKNVSGTKQGNLDLGSSFVDSWPDFRVCSKPISSVVNCRSLRRLQNRKKRFLVVNELAGQYEDSFGDVEKQIVNYFTYKAVRTVLNQLYEMNPPQYTWFYNYMVANKPTDGKRFLRSLGKERHELAERVMITRLHLYGKWIKKCDHGKIYEEISEENLELMRERLMETVVWPSDDSVDGL